MKYLCYLIIAICFCGCAGVRCYPGGETVRTRVKPDSASTFWKEISYYQNPSLDLYSDPVYGLDGIEVSDKYLKKAKLPQTYRNYLADSLNGKQLLYTAKVSYWPNNKNCYVVATITKPLVNPDLSKLTNIENHPELSAYRSQLFHLANGEKVLFFHYTVLKNKKAAFNVLSFHIVWQGNRIISISAISSCEKISYAYVFENDADKLFQTMPIVAE